MIKSFFLFRDFTNIPSSVRTFLLRALIIFTLWKLLYHLLLFPINIPDQQLTSLTASSTAYLLTSVVNTQDVSTRKEEKEGNIISVLYSKNERLIGIANSCNGLELIVLYIGFLFCLPSNSQRQLIFLTVGVIGIIGLNILRCVGLTLLYMNHYPIADFAHKYLFKMVVYAAIFYGWVLYSKKAKYV
jgi:exosortase/archaeosortase family protein